MRKNNRKSKCYLEIGKKYGMLTVLEYLGTNNHRRERRYKCICDCGTIKDYRVYHIIDGNTTSCGCISGLGNRNINWTGAGLLTGSQYGRIRKGARYRNIEFNITAEDAWNLFLKQNRKCAITKVDITLQEKSDYDPNRPFTASLDRVDSSKGYIHGNIQWVHKQINSMKNDMTEKEFIQWCTLVVNNN